MAAARQSAVEAIRLRPTITARAYFPFPVVAPDLVTRVTRTRDALRLAGIRDHADEDTDPGLPADIGLSDVYEAPTPIAVPGARTIRTADLSTLLAQKNPLVLDTNPRGETVPGAICLWGAAIGGTIADEHQKRLEAAMSRLTGGTPAGRSSPWVGTPSVSRGATWPSASPRWATPRSIGTAAAVRPGWRRISRQLRSHRGTGDPPTPAIHFVIHSFH